MKSLTVLSTLFALGAVGVPTRRQSNIDNTMLNFALTLEYLENRFYADGLSQFDDTAFTSAGFPDWVRGRITQIAAHEASHVSYLRSILGSAATAECVYSFPYTDPSSFVALASALEGIGVAAYTGSTQLLTEKSVIMAASSILAVEARHQGWIESAVEHGPGWNTGFETPLDVDQVYTLAASFITSCPSSNPALPVTAFPALSIQQASISAGDTVTLQFNTSIAGPYFAAFFTGLSTIFVSIQHDNSVAVPSGLLGTVFMLVTTSSSSVTDGNTVAGPTVLNFPFLSSVVVPST
ncbi:hypothetical protein DACRYDRAFT_24100 [Dacryopinax primogenitus]|uniref:Uncharacterized protein n=1 Tax=Dacryopinax primogenitus (strain DJM 731) TaxID=1858805 RepID=M5FQ69_DACPD|nr:uncharacterized protein DACRYDRAFT_24100 [Dacryopinax primogenitus]EJT99000.1 hypothetical protein DACRYDRAFT_24100 [Dacryopinax primogenitus]